MKRLSEDTLTNFTSHAKHLYGDLTLGSGHNIHAASSDVNTLVTALRESYKREDRIRDHTERYRAGFPSGFVPCDDIITILDEDIL